jgi:hypothetical protein
MERGAIVLQDFGERVEASKLIQSSKMRVLKLHNTCKKLVRSWCYLQKKLNGTLVKQNIKCTLKSLK